MAKKLVLVSHWGWSTLSEWGNDVRFPDAVRLPDGTIVGLTNTDYLAWKWAFDTAHQRSRATYVPMDENGSVRMRLRSGGSSPGGRSGERWEKREYFVPKGSVFLYGGRCVDCGKDTEYSDDPESDGLCVSCREMVEWQEREVERQAREYAENDVPF